MEQLSSIGHKDSNGLYTAKLSENLRRWSAVRKLNVLCLLAEHTYSEVLSQHHKDRQTMVKSEMLNIASSDSKWRSHAVFVRLDTYDVDPDSKDTPYIFTFNSASLVSFEDLYKLSEDQGIASEGFRDVIHDEERLLSTGIRGRKAALFMIMVVEASGHC